MLLLTFLKPLFYLSIFLKLTSPLKIIKSLNVFISRTGAETEKKPADKGERPRTSQDAHFK